MPRGTGNLHARRSSTPNTTGMDQPAVYEVLSEWHKKKYALGVVLVCFGSPCADSVRDLQNMWGEWNFITFGIDVCCASGYALITFFYFIGCLGVQESLQTAGAGWFEHVW